VVGERATNSPRAELWMSSDRALPRDSRSLIFLDDRVQVIQRLLHGQRVHFTAAIFPGLDGPLQKMSRNLNRHGVGDHLTRLPVELHPRGMRESDPNRPVLNQKLHIDGVGVPRRNCDDQGLILAVQRLPGPAVNGLEVIVHNPKTIAEAIG